MKQQLDGLLAQVSHQDDNVKQVQAAVATTQSRVEDLSTQVSGHRSDVAGLRTEVTQGFAHLEALLSKKHRSE